MGKRYIKNQTFFCTVCGNPGSLLFQFENLSFSDIGFGLFRCRNCQTIFTGPNPTDKDLNAAYAKNYWSTTDINYKNKGYDNWVSRFNEWRVERIIRPFLKALPPKACVLEAGCGAGQLTRIMLRHGLQVEVTESSSEILDFVTNSLGVHGYLGNLPDLPIERKFDGVIFNHVLEHVRDPKENLQAAATFLKPSGIIYTELPNIDSLQFKIFGRHWYHLDLPLHLTHFSPETIDVIAHQTGFQRKWFSLFSIRTSIAGFVVSLFPSLDPRAIRRSGSRLRLLTYLLLQILFLPIAMLEAALKRGGIMRIIYVKKPSSQ